MKNTRLFTFSLLVTAGLAIGTANAQNQRVAYVNERTIYTQMPENEQINQTLSTYKAQLFNDYKALVERFQQNLAEYKERNGSLTGKEIQDQYNHLTKVEFLNDQAYIEKENELRKPIVAKITQAVTAVAQEKNYNGVVDVSDVTYFNTVDDITSLVLQKLGIAPAK